MIYDKADEVIEERFESLLHIHQIGLETSMRGKEFIFDCVLLHYKRHKINLRRRSYIGSPDWIKSKKATMNPNNDNNKYFQYARTVAINHVQIGRNSQII